MTFRTKFRTLLKNQRIYRENESFSLHGVQGVVGSNPAAPTKKIKSNQIDTWEGRVTDSLPSYSQWFTKLLGFSGYILRLFAQFFAQFFVCSTTWGNIMNKKPFGNIDPETRKAWSRQGGLAVSKDRVFMAEIGRKGGLKVSQNKEHMSMLGKKPRNKPQSV